ncbi:MULTISPECIES: hypothetical protein [Nocardia]|uniref:hypothetical protein n=1 Tax=Nocardia TaxID=1817 RepID=UPI0018947215|nr:MULTISPECIES: hypothetical protein [Nocardia]MBF6352768.1 hypothetical protein [Nocardia flavorosea]
MNSSGNLRAGIAACTLAAAAVLVQPVTASAYITDIGVSGGFGLGFIQYGVGCTYTVTAVGAPGDRVFFQDSVNGQPGGGTFGPVAEEEPGVFTADWSPTVIGQHTVSAGGATTEVDVHVGYDFGIICFTLPDWVHLPF